MSLRISQSHMMSLYLLDFRVIVSISNSFLSFLSTFFNPFDLSSAPSLCRCGLFSLFLSRAISPDFSWPHYIKFVITIFKPISGVNNHVLNRVWGEIFHPSPSCTIWNLGMGIVSHNIYGFDYSPMQGLNLNHAIKRGPWLYFVISCVANLCQTQQSITKRAHGIYHIAKRPYRRIHFWVQGDIKSFHTQFRDTKIPASNHYPRKIIYTSFPVKWPGIIGVES